MASQRHVIRTQIVELQVPDEAAAYRLHADVCQLQSTSLTSLIERCCSTIADPNRVVRIERLDIDLGRLDPHDFENQFVDRLSERLPEAVVARLASDRPESGSRWSGPNVTTPMAAQIARAGEHGPPSEAIAEAPGERELELLRHFMRLGTLPWWADLREPEPLAAAVRRTIATSPRTIVTMLRDAMSGDATPSRSSLARLVGALDESVLTELVALLAPDVVAGVAPSDLIDVVAGSAALEKLAPRRRRSMTWRALLESALVDVGHDSAAVTRQTLSLVARAAAVDFGDLTDGALDAARHMNSLRAVKHTFELASRLTPDASDPVEVHIRSESEADRDPTINRLGADDEAFDDFERVETQSGGLVLLATFLHRFLDRSELLDGNTFLDSAARQRAVGLLSFLATGAPTPIEYLTTLEKTLCGMAFTEVIDFGEPVTDDEADECSTLLAAMIEHAGVFGDLSLDGLRGSFLRRPGVLAAEDGTWVLRVERRPYDVILDRLPWSYDWLALPWMRSPMRVEW